MFNPSPGGVENQSSSSASSTSLSPSPASTQSSSGRSRTPGLPGGSAPSECGPAAAFNRAARASEAFAASVDPDQQAEAHVGMLYSFLVLCCAVLCVRECSLHIRPSDNLLCLFFSFLFLGTFCTRRIGRRRFSIRSTL